VVVLVTAGELTLYMADDKKCRPHTYATGQAFIDHGRGNVHIARNEGTVPHGALRDLPRRPGWRSLRIDVPDPGNCPF
jgi:hypothetical protein